MLNGKAKQKLSEVMVQAQGKIKKIFISDSINKEDLPEWIEVISTSDILANNITNIFQGFPVDR
jgi:phosphoribosylpyrophosphate synthetase